MFLFSSSVLWLSTFTFRSWQQVRVLNMNILVVSHPDFFFDFFLLQGRQIFGNVSGGVHLNGMTLVLRYLTHSSGGNYACEVSNDVGKGLSNALHLQLNSKLIISHRRIPVPRPTATSPYFINEASIKPACIYLLSPLLSPWFSCFVK